MKVSATLKGSICLLGLVSASNYLATPANADQAAARASASITNPSSSTQSVSGEVLLPDGFYFDNFEAPTLVITPTISSPTASASSANIDNLSFYAGEAKSSESGKGTISSVVAAILKGTNSGDINENTSAFVKGVNISPINENTPVNAKSTEDAAAIIRASAGVNALD